MAAPPVIPLALGAGALWLLSQLSKGGQGGAPPGQGGQQPSGGDGGGLPPGTVPALIGAGSTAAGIAAPLIVKAVTAPGVAAPAATPGAAGAGATPATVGAGAADTTDAFAVTGDTTVAGSAAGAGVLVAAVLTQVALNMAIEFEHQEQLWLTTKEVQREANNRYTRMIFNRELAGVDNMLSVLISKLNSLPPPYVNLNLTNAARALGRFGAMRTLLSSPVASVFVPTAATSGVPGSATPYGFTRVDVQNDPVAGVASPDATIAYYASAVAGFYVNSIDPRLPVDALMKFRAFARWRSWTKLAQMNRCLYSYYTAKDALGACNTRNADGSCADASVYALSPNDFEMYAWQFFGGLPASFQPPAVVPWNDYQSLNAQAYMMVQRANANAAAVGAEPVDFNQMAARIRFCGTAMAVSQASIIGFGDGRQWTAPWPGDQQFTSQIGAALGLDWPLTSRQTPDGQRFLLFDPATGWYIDVVGTRESNGGLKVYQEGSDGVTMTPYDPGPDYGDFGFQAPSNSISQGLTSEGGGTSSLVPIPGLSASSLLPLLAIGGVGAALFFAMRKKKSLSGYSRSRRRKRSR